MYSPGAVCVGQLALALSLPQTFGPDRNLILNMTFGVVLFTLIIQGTTLRPFLNWFKIVPPKNLEMEYEIGKARLFSLKAGVNHIVDLNHRGLLSDHALQMDQSDLDQQITSLSANLHEMQQSKPDIAVDEYQVMKREFLHAQRSAVMSLRDTGAVSAHIVERIITEIGNEMISLEQGVSEVAD